MNCPPIPYDRNNETQHTTYCLTGDASCVDLIQQDGQILLLTADVNESQQLCINLQDAYALGLWLIGAATAIHCRYPEMAGRVVEGNPL